MLMYSCYYIAGSAAYRQFMPGILCVSVCVCAEGGRFCVTSGCLLPLGRLPGFLFTARIFCSVQQCMLSCPLLNKQTVLIRTCRIITVFPSSSDLSDFSLTIASWLDTWHLYIVQVPLDAVDLQHVSLLYTQGEMAAVAPIYDYDFRMLTEIVSEASWRQLLFWLGPPGIVIGFLALLTLKEPRHAKAVAQKKPFLGGRLRLPFMSGVPPEPLPSGLQGCLLYPIGCHALLSGETSSGLKRVCTCGQQACIAAVRMTNNVPCVAYRCAH